MKDSIISVNSIFEQPWWLDAVAPGQWDAVTIEKNGKMIARLPYVKTKRLGFNLLGMPAYTQTLGYWIDDTGGKNEKKYAREKDLISQLISGLPTGYNVDIMLDHKCNYLFPFIWNGFDVKLKYSYRFEDVSDTDVLWTGMSSNIRTDIKKAKKTVNIEDNHSIDDLIDMINKTFVRQGRIKNNNTTTLQRIDSALIEHKARKLLCAVDALGRIHAAAYFVYDDNCCYYLAGGGDPTLRNSGAGSLLVWEGIQFAATVSKSFDFEGSMIEPIERYFRAFGGIPTPYWHITRLNTSLNIAERAKPIVKKIIGWQ